MILDFAVAGAALLEKFGVWDELFTSVEEAMLKGLSCSDTELRVLLDEPEKQIFSVSIDHVELLMEQVDLALLVEFEDVNMALTGE
jgi:hypothetical protein